MRFEAAWAIAKWEFSERVRTKAFVISTILTPIIMIAFSVLPTMFAGKGPTEVKTFAVVTTDASLCTDTETMLSYQYKTEEGTPLYKLQPVSASTDAADKELLTQVFEGKFAGVFYVPTDFVASKAITYKSESVGNTRELERVLAGFQSVLTQRAISKYNIDPNIISEILTPVVPSLQKITKDGKSTSTNFLAEFLGAYGVMLLVLILITATSQQLVRSLLDEKTNRIIEIILSSCSATELLAGKLVGLGLMGLFQGAVWGGMALIAVEVANVDISFASTLPLVLLFAVTGYVFYASVLIGLGSTVTSEQEAQNVTAYTIMFAVFPTILILAMLEEPNGTVAKVLSFIPFFTAQVMSFRIALQTPPLWEILASYSVLLLSIIGVVVLSSRIFHVGILTFGKRIPFTKVFKIAFTRRK